MVERDQSQINSRASADHPRASRNQGLPFARRSGRMARAIELLKEEMTNVAKVREQLQSQLLDIQKEQTIMAEQLEDYRSVMNQYPFMESN